MSLGTLGGRLRQAAERWPEGVFVQFAGREDLTYSEADRLASGIAAGSIRAGVSPGDRVPVMAPNRPETIVSWFGLARAGAVMTPLNVHLKGDLLSYMFDDSEGRIALVYEDYVPELLELDPPSLEAIVVLRADPSVRPPILDTASRLELLDLADWSAAAKEEVLPEVDSFDPGLIIYTSGTTGRPKGVVFSHNYALYVGSIYADQIGYTSDDVLFVCVPLYHTLALNPGVLAALHVGAAIALYERFSVSKFWQQVREVGATAVLGSGNMGELMMSTDPDPKDLDNSIRIAHVIPAPPEPFRQRFGVDTVVHQLYGSTEVVPTEFLIGDAEVAGSCGRISADFAGIVADDRDQELPPGEVGELLVRPMSPAIMFSEYHRKPETTIEAFKNLWFHTGDLLRKDEQGNLFFIGRKKEAIRRRGEMVSASEVERVLIRHPTVAQCAVVGVTAGDGGEEEIKAVLVAVDGQAIDPPELCQFAIEELAYFMVPRYFDVVEELPMTASHRVRKVLLSEHGVTESTWDREAHGIQIRRQR